MERLLIIGGLFVAAGSCEIGGGYLAWGVVVDGFRPDRWDLLGATICVLGVLRDHPWEARWSAGLDR